MDHFRPVSTEAHSQNNLQIILDALRNSAERYRSQLLAVNSLLDTICALQWSDADVGYIRDAVAIHSVSHPQEKAAAILHALMMRIMLSRNSNGHNEKKLLDNIHRELNSLALHHPIQAPHLANLATPATSIVLTLRMASNRYNIEHSHMKDLIYKIHSIAWTPEDAAAIKEVAHEWKTSPPKIRIKTILATMIECLEHNHAADMNIQPIIRAIQSEILAVHSGDAGV